MTPISLKNVRLTTFYPFRKPTPVNATEAIQQLKKFFRDPPPSMVPTQSEWMSITCAPWKDRATKYHHAVVILESAIGALQEHLINAQRAGQVSEQFRRARNKRWVGSYTRSVVDSLQGFWNKIGWAGGEPIRAAQKLLRDYHDTMHVAYEERDAARRELEAAYGTVTYLKQEREVRERALAFAEAALFHERGKHTAERDAARELTVAEKDLREAAEARLQRAEKQISTLQAVSFRPDTRAFDDLRKERDAALKLAANEKAICAMAMVNLQAATGELVSVHRQMDSFKKRVKDSVKDALIASGVL